MCICGLLGHQYSASLPPPNFHFFFLSKVATSFVCVVAGVAAFIQMTRIINAFLLIYSTAFSRKFMGQAYSLARPTACYYFILSFCLKMEEVGGERVEAASAVRVGGGGG